MREEFLFSSPALPPSLPLTCSHFHSSLGQFVGSSHLTGFSLTRLALLVFSLSPFLFFFFLGFVFVFPPFMCALKFESQPSEKAAPDNCCHNCLLLSLRVTFMDSQNYSRTLFLCIHEAVLRRHREKCAPKALSQPVTPLSTFQRLCCQTMVLPPRPIALRICNA